MMFFGRKPRLTAKKLSTNREDWLTRLKALSAPVIAAGATGDLHGVFAEPVSRLAAAAGVLCGLSSFLEAPAQPGEEKRHRDLLHGARSLLMDIITPQSPDCCLVPAGSYEPTPFVPQNGLLAFALLKGKNAFLKGLDETEKEILIQYIRSAKRSRPKRDSEELLFGAMMELLLYELTGDCETQNLDYTMTILMDHYRGDGVFAPKGGYRWNYENSFFVYPMLDLMLPYLPRWFCGRAKEWQAAARQAFSRMLTMESRLISPDGSFPVFGYGMCLRTGAFHTLAHGAWREALPQGLAYSLVRESLYRVIKRTLDAPGTTDDDGFLLPGLCGSQPSLCEPDFTRGQLYGCMTVFAPLGLRQNHAFWGLNTENSPWQKAWGGENIPLDHCH